MNLAIMTWEDDTAESPKLIIIHEDDENEAIFAAMLLVRQHIAAGAARVTVLNSTPEKEEILADAH